MLYMFNILVQVHVSYVTMYTFNILVIQL